MEMEMQNYGKVEIGLKSPKSRNLKIWNWKIGTEIQNSRRGMKSECLKVVS